MASVLGPALLLAVMAGWYWQRVNREAGSAITRTVALLNEDALRILETDQVVLSRIAGRIAGMSWPEIISHERELSQFLKDVAAQVPDVDGAFLADASGEPQVASRLYPVPARGMPMPTSANIADRYYFRAAHAGAEITVDGPFRSRLTGAQVFDVVRRLTDANGDFRGVAALVISPKHLVNFWKTVAAPGDIVALVRDDGVVIARYPALNGGVEASPRFTPAMMRKLLSRTAGQFTEPVETGSGVQHRIGFLRLQGYPLTIVYGVDRRNVVRAWYPTVAAFGGLAALAAIALLLAASAVIRRARGEARALAAAEQAALALRDSEERHRAAYEKTPVPMHILNPAGEIVAVSERWLDLMGYARAEVIGRPISDFHAPVSATILRQGGWQRAVVQGGIRDAERQYVRKTGELLDVLISARLERDADGRFQRMLVVVIDVTQQRRAEAAFRQAQKMEAVGQLTGGIAHDFNNLLTVIIGNIDGLQRRFESKLGDAAELRRITDAVLRAATRAATLVQRLLAFSRRQPLEPKALNLNRLISGMTDLLHSTLGESIAIEAILADGLWWTTADGNQLESALLNLAVNARDAMPNGGKLMIETANTYLDDAYAATHEEVTAGQYVMLAVSDTGVGMSGEIIVRAVEPFFTTKSIGQGTGLGLSQVYGFVKQSGGHLKIYSEVGQGTTVKLYLPRLTAKDEENGTQDEPRSTPDDASRHETILVVEDDEDVRMHSVDILRELGYGAIEAADGASALRALEAHPEIELLFTDVGLPGGINGRELADQARRQHPDLKVLFTTGYARNAIVHQGRLDPGVELIVKPFTHAGLADKIRQVLDARPNPSPARR